jgi:asparagine synthase (glutamine-hydrolysing)
MPDYRGKIQIIKWYDLVTKQYKGTFEQASQKFEEIFKSAIALHIRADVPVGTALSGGLDSSAIVCEINNLLRKQGGEHLQKTFSSCSSDERYSEKKWMGIIIEYTKVDAHFVFPKGEDIFKLTPELIWYHDEPYQSQSAFLGYHVFKSAKINNVTVLINGQGADEYLGGYGQFTAARFRKMFYHLEWTKLINEIHNSGYFVKYTYPFAFKVILSSILPVFLKSFLADRFGPYQQIKKIIDYNRLNSTKKSPNEFIPVCRETVQDISKYVTFYSSLPKYLKWEDRNSMANSVEARVPFLDYRLVEFAYNLPNDYLDFQGETKRILRQGLKNILPDKIKNRKDKKGFITPEEGWVKEDNPALFRSKIEEAIKITKGIIKPEALVYFDKVVAGKIPFNYTYWRLILFAEWVNRFNIKLN